MHLSKLTLTAAALAALSACSEPRTVSYFEAHEAERKARLAECRDDVAMAREDGDCINAQAAESQAKTKASIKALNEAVERYTSPRQ